MKGAEALLKALEREGVEVIFGHPGGAIMPTYDALYDSPIRHILVRHEQGGVHAATAYARASGRVGVVMATSGPGALNLVTGLADAYMDSTPVVAITGNVPRALIGTDAFQEADVTGVTMPITKHNYLVQEVNDIPRVVREAFHIASSGRPGPVLIDLPKDVQLSEFTGTFDVELDLPGYKPTTKGHPKQIERALDALEKAERPILMVGGGAQHAHGELLAFAERTGIPVITTLMGLGAFPGNHPLWLGMPGMHGTVAANRAIHHADVILAIGLRFDDRVTGKVSRFAPHAHTIIHVDIDPAEIGKLVRTHIPIVGDARSVLREMLKGAKPLKLASWWRQLEEWRTRYPLRWKPKPYLQSQEVIKAFAEATGGHAIVTTGVGQHQMFAAQFFAVTRPRSFITSGGLGTMGVGLPFAIGAKVARPEELVIDFDGDGSFQMTLQELATVVKYKLDVKVVILNNGYLGMVRQWQDLFHAKRYSEVYLADSNPDFARLAEAYGIKGVRVERKEDLMKGVEAVLSADGPVVAEFKVYHEEGVFPMIPAGGAAEDMILEHPAEREEVEA
ncbi:acetolactate synthase, large subunit, biosynthetic type [Thermus scotoductus]|uniref:Acetolactate synthase n=1 Tax=Thermus scotoductus TaxID=37636 RepID=A0A430V3S0_THESC|nr:MULTISPECIES: biosynthetic-type acetolactate synthase large subunit [Thermus]RTG96775.1 acetolactate synthase, large subunit, biosynthetic type [Thermus scotoductus]RTH05818.1 acetolactate synthase, large subunit, biosynthetic type [Thermus scotoductus]RTH10662.1 acetolactate synthase, large subunit, biosynthetic type [Thermus scotoductus]RTH10892.1 acetolactate synthase, large subunit, biosynthetic type [Thermus scotoductus]RTH12839.1 acetolactate synthase, large subunit, biosynthetic type